MLIFDGNPDNASFVVIGSNVSVVAEFGSTLDNAYITFYGNDPTSNIGYMMGSSNQNLKNPVFTLSTINGPVPEFTLSNYSLGLNNVSPNYTLDVNGNINVSNNFYNKNKLIGLWKDDNTTNSVYFLNSNIGIGTTLPTTNLHVQGNTFISGTIFACNLTPSAFIDTTNATNILTGTLPSSIFPTTGVVAGQYGSGVPGQNVGVPVITVDQYGRLTTAYNIYLSSSAVVDTTVASNITSGLLSSNILPPTGVVPGNYGTQTKVPNITVDSTGRIFSLSNVPILISYPQIIGLQPVSYLGNYSNLYNIPFTFNSNIGTTTYYNGTGNIGIGTTSAISKLHVEGDIFANGRITASNLVLLGDFTTLNTVTSNTEQLVITNAGSATALEVVQDGPYTVAEFYSQHSNLALQVSSTGNIGIGIKDPSKTLYVQGDIYASSTITAPNLLASAFIDTTNASNIATGTIKESLIPLTGVKAGYYGIPSALPVFTVDGKGRLTVASNQTIIIGSNQVLGLCNVATTANYNDLFNRTFILNNTNAFYSGGNVGISTNNPDATLSVGSGSSDTTSRIKINVANNGSINDRIMLSYLDNSSRISESTGGNVYHYAGQTSDTTSTFHFMTGNSTTYTERMTIGATFGYVGVNNTNPLYNLDTGGSINFSTNLYNSGILLFTGGILQSNVLPITGVNSGYYGSASSNVILTVDTKGRLSVASNQAIQIIPAQVTGLSPSATIDTTNASNIATGTIKESLIPLTGVTAGYYGTPATNAIFTVDGKGRLTVASNQSIQIIPGQVTGLAPSATTDTTNATNISSGTLNILRLATSGVAQGTYGSASVTPSISVDQYGRITSLSTASIAISYTQVSGLAPSATIDTTNASNIATGTIKESLIPLTGVTAGYYGTPASNAIFIVDGKGRLTLASNQAIQIIPGQVTGLAPSATTDTTNASNISSGTIKESLIPLTGVTAGYYGTPASNAIFIVDGKGRLTLASNQAIQIAPSQVTGLAPSATTDTTNASNIATGTIKESLIPLTGVAAGYYGNASTHPVFTVDGKGRLTIASNQSIQIAPSQVTGLTAICTGGAYSNLTAIPFTYNSNVGTTTYYNGLGNIGIGTTQAISTFHVWGDVRANGTIIASNISILGDLTVLNTITSNTERMVVYNQSFGPALSVTQTSYDIVAEYYKYNSNIVMQLDSTGNVGIGTKSPTKTLYVVGDIYATNSIIAPNFAPSATIDATNATNITSGSFSSNLLQPTTVNPGTYGSATNSITFTVDSKGRLTSATNQAILIPAGQVTGLAPSATTDTTIATNITSGTLPEARIPITTVTANNYGSANSVATFTVDAKGRLTTAATTSIAISSTQVSGLATSATTDTTNATNITTGTLLASVLATSGVNASFYGIPSAHPVFSVDTKGRITLASNQAILIGSNQVTGLASSATIDTTNASNIISGILSSNILQPSGVTAGVYGSLTSVPQIVVDNKGRITFTSNVSISLTSNQLPLSGVVGGIYGSSISIPSLTIDTYGRVTYGTTCNIVISSAIATGQYSNLYGLPFLYDSTGSNICMNSNIVGNIGIGTTLANYKLDVNGIINAISFRGDGSQLTGVVTGSGGGGSQWTTAPSYISPNTIYINSNVGIGTNIPQANLDVIGSIRCSNITLTGSTFIANDTQFYRSALMINPIRQFFTATDAQTVFQLSSSTVGRYVAYSSNTEVYQNGMKLGYSNLTLNDYTVSTIQNSTSTTFAITLATPASLGDYIDIIVYPSLISTDVTLQPGYVYQQFYDLWSANNNNVYYTNGNVGIGTNAPAYNLHVAGNIYATNSIVAFSDQSIKTDIETIPNALELVKNLRGVKYTRRDNNERQIGVIAQEVLPYLPEVVTTSSEGLAVAYGNIVGLLIEAIKELSDEVTDLRSRVIHN
jgi:hypothetical protein